MIEALFAPIAFAVIVAAGGAVGHGVAALLGSDPKQAMDEDLVRFNSLLEEGRTRAHGRTVRREALG